MFSDDLEDYHLLIDEFEKLSTVENDTIWYIDEDNDVRMPLTDWIEHLRKEAGK
jgi:hypothetical protein